MEFRLKDWLEWFSGGAAAPELLTWNENSSKSFWNCLLPGRELFFPESGADATVSTTALERTGRDLYDTMT